MVSGDGVEEGVVMEARCSLGGLSLVPGWGRAFLTQQRILWRQARPGWLLSPFYSGPPEVEICLEGIERLQTQRDTYGPVLEVWATGRWYFLRLGLGWKLFGEMDLAREWQCEIEARRAELRDRSEQPTKRGS